MDRPRPVADGDGRIGDEAEAVDGQSADAGATPAVSADGTWRPEEVPEMLPARSDAGDADALDYAAAVRDAAALDAATAGDHVDHLVGIARRTDGESRTAAVEALDLIGRRRPATLAVWSEELVALATDSHPVAASAGLRALAHLAEANPTAAAAGAEAATEAVRASDPCRRRAALRLVAALAKSDADRVAGADRGVAAAMGDADPEVRAASALCAADVLAAAPDAFPRTASALAARIDDGEAGDHALLALIRFARTHPARVPEKRAAIEALGAASDRNLGIAEGATKDALTSLLEVAHGYSF